METHILVETTHLSVRAGGEFLGRSSDVHSFLEAISALFRSRVAKALDVGSGSRKSPSVGVKTAKRPAEASGSKGTKKPADGLSSDEDTIDVD